MCENLPKDVVFCNGCKKSFCKYCITNYLNKKSDLCPNCFSTWTAVSIDQNRKMSKQFFMLAQKLDFKIKCKNYQNGCKFQQGKIEGANKTFTDLEK